MDQLKYFKRKLGDRYDGWRVRNVDTVFSVIPFFLRTRMDSQNFFEEQLNIDHLEEFIKQHKEGHTRAFPHAHHHGGSRSADFSAATFEPLCHLEQDFCPATTSILPLPSSARFRTKARKPSIKPNFLPTDTLQDVVRKVLKEQEDNQQIGQENSSDAIAKIMGPASFLFASHHRLFLIGHGQGRHHAKSHQQGQSLALLLVSSHQHRFHRHRIHLPPFVRIRNLQSVRGHGQENTQPRPWTAPVN